MYVLCRLFLFKIISLKWRGEMEKFRVISSVVLIFRWILEFLNLQFFIRKIEITDENPRPRNERICNWSNFVIISLFFFSRARGGGRKGRGDGYDTIKGNN